MLETIVIVFIAWCFWMLSIEPEMPVEHRKTRGINILRNKFFFSKLIVLFQFVLILILWSRVNG